MPAQRISEIVSGGRAITADTDLRLRRFFGLPAGRLGRAPRGGYLRRLDRISEVVENARDRGRIGGEGDYT